MTTERESVYRKIIKNKAEKGAALRLFSFWCLNQIAEQSTDKDVAKCAKLPADFPKGEIPDRVLYLHRTALRESVRQAIEVSRLAWEIANKASDKGEDSDGHLKKAAVNASIQEYIIKTAIGTCAVQAWMSAETSAHWMRMHAVESGLNEAEIEKQQNEALDRFLAVAE